MQLQEIQAVESSFQHVYNGGELRNKGRHETKADADGPRGRRLCVGGWTGTPLARKCEAALRNWHLSGWIGRSNGAGVFCLLEYMVKKIGDSYKSTEV